MVEKHTLDEDEFDLDYDAAIIRESYARYGLAMYQAQVLEHGLVNFLAFHRLVSAHDGLAEPVTADPWTKEFKRVFSELVKRFSNRADAANEDLTDALSKCIEDRNFLAHSYWRERVEWSVDNEGRRRIIEEVDEMRARFEDVDGKIAEIFFSMVARFGITPEKVRREMRDMVHRLTNSPTINLD